jgi:hypothetical protein
MPVIHHRDEATARPEDSVNLGEDGRRSLSVMDDTPRIGDVEL